MVCKGDGSYGWKYSTKTKNRCRLSGVTESNSDILTGVLGSRLKAAKARDMIINNQGLVGRCGIGWRQIKVRVFGIDKIKGIRRNM